jgi:hypothetical protein
VFNKFSSAGEHSSAAHVLISLSVYDVIIRYGNNIATPCKTIAYDMTIIYQVIQVIIQPGISMSGKHQRTKLGHLSTTHRTCMLRTIGDEAAASR